MWAPFRPHIATWAGKLGCQIQFSSIRGCTAAAKEAPGPEVGNSCFHLGPQGTPKSSQNRAKDSQKSLQGLLRRPLGKEVEKRVIFRPPGTVKMSSRLKRELNFHFSKGSPKESQNGAKMEPKWSPNPSQDVPRALQERSRKRVEKRHRNRS